MKINHKPENYFGHIDGLRAIAVLSVVLHHLIPTAVPGGFIGVDVFFVISGYLITGILIREMESNKFSFLGFYERRARRIFPALFAVLVFTLIGSYILFLPTDFVSSLRGALGTVFFVSNIVFWKDLAEGYFAAMDSALNPLVHTWSLAVEEQFYLLFPVLLLICYKVKLNNFLLIFSLFFLISLIASEYFIDTKGVAVFFLSPFRAWELLAGSILALKVIPNINSKTLKEVFSCLGLLAIFFACFFFTEYTPFPGLSALIPVLGSAAVIHSGMGEESKILNILKSKPLIFFGLISYSLYLWHWPVVVFANYLNPVENFSPLMVICLLSLSVFLSTISYYIIEQPFRAKKSFNRKFIFASSFCIMLALSLFTIFGIKMSGFEKRFSSEIIAYDKAREPEHIYKSCDDIINSGDWCLIGDIESTDEILLFGDSHLMSWAPALNEALIKTGQKGYLAMQSNCPPIINIELWQTNINCPIKNESVKNFILQNNNINKILLSGYWPAYLKKDTVLPMRVSNISDRADHEIAHEGFSKTIEWMLDLDKSVIMIGPVPVYDESVPLLLALNELFGRDYLQSDYNDQIKKSLNLNKIIYNFGNNKNFHYVDALKWICTPECKTKNDSLPIYFDSNHLNVKGSKLYVDEFIRVFNKISF
tara:strand:- start:4899 stop:6851 length:1953 start_codon:yes stop_codon:yes gene_type:complete